MEANFSIKRKPKWPGIELYLRESSMATDPVQTIVEYLPEWVVGTLCQRFRFYRRNEDTAQGNQSILIGAVGQNDFKSFTVSLLKSLYGL